MSQPTSLIYTDTPDSFPALYRLPPNQDLSVQSVVVRWNGTGASGSFKACLSVLSQDGRLMARVFPDTEFQTGDTGIVTYAPFLRKGQPSANGRPSVGVERQAPQSIAHGTLTNVAFDTALENSAGMWSAGTPTRITSVANGVYAISAQIVWDANAVGERRITIRKNGGAASNSSNWMAVTVAGVVTAQNLATFQFGLNVGEYVELEVGQSSGGALNVIAALGALRIRTD